MRGRVDGYPGLIGLTLIEVLFALSVLAFALLGVAGMFPSAMRSVQSGGETTKATVLAREIIDMIRADAFDSLVSRYNGFDTSKLTVTCPATLPTPSSPDANYNKKKWTCDIRVSGTRDMGQGLPGGRGTIAVACVDFDTTSPFKEKNITCPTPGPTDYSTRKVTVAVTWGAQGPRSVSLVTYVTKTE
jgi:type IV pilus modification protein PilV